MVNSDIYCDFDFASLACLETARGPDFVAHLILVNNPAHHPEGDFHLDRGRLRLEGAGPRLTFSGIGVYNPTLFAGIARGEKRQLAALLKPEMARGRVSGEHHKGLWMDIGTPERLAALEALLLAGGRR